jgi:hypothetical protein
MEINLNGNINSPGRVQNAERTIHGTKPDAPQGEFSHVDALKLALSQTPEVRPEVVARARKVVSDAPYPPTEIIQKISHLLAMHMMAPSNRA